MTVDNLVCDFGGNIRFIINLSSKVSFYKVSVCMQFILKTAIVIWIKFGSEIANKVDSLPYTTIQYGFNLITLKIVVRVVYTIKHVYSAVFTTITY